MPEMPKPRATYPHPEPTDAELLTSDSVISVTLWYMRRDISAMNSKIDSLTGSFVSLDRVDNLERRLADLEADRKWLILTIISAVLLAGLSLLLRTKAGV